MKKVIIYNNKVRIKLGVDSYVLPTFIFHKKPGVDVAVITKVYEKLYREMRTKTGPIRDLAFERR